MKELKQCLIHKTEHFQTTRKVFNVLSESFIYGFLKYILYYSYENASSATGATRLHFSFFLHHNINLSTKSIILLILITTLLYFLSISLKYTKLHLEDERRNSYVECLFLQLSVLPNDKIFFYTHFYKVLH